MTIAAAGRQLAAVQDFATRYSRQSTGSLLWWDWEPERWLAALADQRAIGPTEVSEGRTALAEALELVHVAEQSAINWTMCHYDHKPNNVHCNSKMVWCCSTGTKRRCVHLAVRSWRQRSFGQPPQMGLIGVASTPS